MPRAAPSATLPDPPTFNPKPWVIHLKTITPVFGGSATPRQVDEAHPIRAASIRGHLRFWWRATAGAKYATSKELFEAEEKIWGSAKQEGLVRLEVTPIEGRKGQKVEIIKREEKESKTGKVKFDPSVNIDYSKYFLFPFLGDHGKESMTAGELPENPLIGSEFLLNVSLNFSGQPKDFAKVIKSEVLRSLRAWTSFGGIGSRTRRGCGALCQVIPIEGDAITPKLLPDDMKELLSWFERSNKSFSASTTISIMLGSWIIYSEVKNTGDAIRIWKDLGYFWQTLHKGHFSHGKGRLSQSAPVKWKDHSNLLSHNGDRTIHAIKPYWGLPIVYQNQKYGPPVFHGTIEAGDSQGRRMASPVILKPCAFKDGVRGLVVILNSPEPKEISIGSKFYELKFPLNDPVLNELRAKSPPENARDVVRAAANMMGYTHEIQL